jgi:hypothetical protein
MPANLKEGRDPFFRIPTVSVRNFVVKATPQTKNTHPTLILTGMPLLGQTSGHDQRKNFRQGRRRRHHDGGWQKSTFASSKIKAESVIVEARGERRELVLRKR